MNVIPAKIAGVKNITITTPTPYGIKNNIILATAGICGVNNVFTIGGAQAIASLAYGTKTIKKVDKIVGPGNFYVNYAKKKVFGDVGIDMIAGPSEILILCDKYINSDYIVMDLFSQAEHDKLSKCFLISLNEKYIDNIIKKIKKKIKFMLRKKIIKNSLNKNSLIIKANNLNEICKIINIISPEHLEICLKNSNKILNNIYNAGAIFLGKFSPEVLGDYCAGPSHVLPTSGNAKFSSCLGIYDFLKFSSIIDFSKKGLKKVFKYTYNSAFKEGLQCHALSIKYRNYNV
uniref:Histidinol dehydrogenase n=1 Tax=Clastoptera arizonana TaxID=38151 RepID=A0A1B6CS27_9HEMI